MLMGSRWKGCLCPSPGTGLWDGPVSGRTRQRTDNPREQAPRCPFIFIMCEVGGCKVRFPFIWLSLDRKI